MRELIFFINIIVLLIPLLVSKFDTRKSNIEDLKRATQYEEPCIKKIRNKGCD